MLKAGEEINYDLSRTSYDSFLFVVYIQIQYQGETFTEKDAIGLSNICDFKLNATRDSYVINIEVPEINNNE